MDNTMTKKEPFYVFTAIDGVLFDAAFVQHVHGVFSNGIDEPVLKPTSIIALDSLLSQLEKTYDTKLILTSHRRTDLADCVHYLKFHNFKYNKPIFATRLGDGSRGDKVLDFIKDDGYDPKRQKSLGWFAEKILKKAEIDGDFKNYVVIDKKSSALSTQIPQNNLILTDFNKKSLTGRQVALFMNYIKQNQISEKQK